MSDLRQYETRDGPMLGFASDVYISASLERYGEYSLGERRLFEQVVRPGHVVVEVGANIGSHTVALARMCAPGKLYAFEPQQRVFQVLCANLANNGVANVIAYPHACGATAGSVVIPEVDYGTHENAGSISVRPEGAAGLRTPMVALDDLELPACDFLKIDVEGFEPEVLRGASKTLLRCRPILSVENDRASQQQTILDLIHGYGYRIYWHVPTLFHPENFRGSKENIFPGVGSLNVVAIPDESPKQMDVPVIDPTDWQSPIQWA